MAPSKEFHAALTGTRLNFPTLTPFGNWALSPRFPRGGAAS